MPILPYLILTKTVPTCSNGRERSASNRWCNEPANLVSTVRLIAELKGVDEAMVREATTGNAKRLFGLD